MYDLRIFFGVVLIILWIYRTRQWKMSLIRHHYWLPESIISSSLLDDEILIWQTFFVVSKQQSLCTKYSLRIHTQIIVNNGTESSMSDIQLCKSSSRQSFRVYMISVVIRALCFGFIWFLSRRQSWLEFCTKWTLSFHNWVIFLNIKLDYLSAF